jgi:hypothetical protein
VQNRPENREAWQAKLAAFFFQLGRQVLLQQRVKNDAGGRLNFGQHPIELFLCSDEWVHVLDRHNSSVLRRGGASDCNQGLSGRVGDQVQLEIAGRGRHGKNLNNLSAVWEKAMAWTAVQE